MQITLKAIPFPFSQELRSYLAALTFQEINWLLQDGRLYVPNQKDLPDYAQRQANSTNINALALYILDSLQNGRHLFFPTIALNLQCVFEHSPDHATRGERQTDHVREHERRRHPLGIGSNGPSVKAASDAGGGGSS